MKGYWLYLAHKHVKRSKIIEGKPSLWCRFLMFITIAAVWQDVSKTGPARDL